MSGARGKKREKTENRILNYDLQLKSYSRVPHRLTDECGGIRSTHKEEENSRLHTLAHANTVRFQFGTVCMSVSIEAR